MNLLFFLAGLVLGAGLGMAIPGIICWVENRQELNPKDIMTNLAFAERMKVEHKPGAHIKLTSEEADLFMRGRLWMLNHLSTTTEEESE